MSEISPVSNNPAAASLVGGSDGAMTQAFDQTMGKDDFLKLLMAQLEHQDPMNPMEDHAFVAQLATFSGLEQQMMTNQRLEDLQLSQLSASNAQLSGFIGKKVTAQGDTLTVKGTEADPIGLQLNGPAANVSVTVRSSDGKVVKTLDYKNLGSGSHNLDWAPVDANGQKLPAGTYKVEIEATDANGGPVTSSSLVSGIVEKVSFDRGYPELIVNGRRIVPADIISIETSGSAPSSTTTDSSASSSLPASGSYI